MTEDIHTTLFLKIISGEIPAEKIYEDEHSYAFLTIEPNTIGHSVVVPKVHSKDILDIDDESLKNLIVSVKKVSEILKRTLNADGINVHQNNGAVSGQAVWHTHFHVIPRYSTDGLKHWVVSHPSQAELHEIAENIRKNA